MTLSNAEENPHAGKGSSVLLDIGEDVGAIVLTLPRELEDTEIERRPVGLDGAGIERRPVGREREAIEHGHGHGHEPGEHHHGFPHVGVVPRPSPEGELIYSAVFFDVPEGTYELHVLPDGPVRLTVAVIGGTLTEATWPE